MNYAEIASARFGEGFSCAQAVFSAFAETLGIERDQALKIASGFGGGMGRMALTCGAVTGAILVIGLRYGSAVPGEGSKEKVFGFVQEFTEAFIARNGSIGCRELLGCDISTQEGFEQIKKEKLGETVCKKLILDAVAILEDMI